VNLSGYLATGEKTFPVQIENLSLSGAGLRAPISLQANTRLTGGWLTFSTPYHPRIRVPLKSIVFRRADAKGWLEGGAAFDELELAERDRLLEYCLCTAREKFSPTCFSNQPCRRFPAYPCKTWPPPHKKLPEAGLLYPAQHWQREKRSGYNSARFTMEGNHPHEFPPGRPGCWPHVQGRFQPLLRQSSWQLRWPGPKGCSV